MNVPKIIILMLDLALFAIIYHMPVCLLHSSCMHIFVDITDKFLLMSISYIPHANKI